MSSEGQRFSRQSLLDALEQGWKPYLSQLNALPADEHEQYAHQQGYARVQDVLVHIVAWWELSMQRTVRVLTGPPEIRPEDHALFPESMDAFNAEVIAQYQHWTRAAVEAKFTATLVALERFLLDLPETALDDERIHRWMRSEAIDHYQAHRLPNVSRES
ncbi:MAG TPA: ClbS/DfsB family four-helix bundle protein [Ktedonobacterales bacterium]|nr:ClbS/DfsB family four-helix bundle protein [Ktedonobacterales bacterium]